MKIYVLDKSELMQQLMKTIRLNHSNGNDRLTTRTPGLFSTRIQEIHHAEPELPLFRLMQRSETPLAEEVVLVSARLEKKKRNRPEKSSPRSVKSVPCLPLAARMATWSSTYA